MTRPRILIAPHVRELDTVLGRLRAAIVYDRYLDRIVTAGGEPLTAWPGSADVEGLVALADGVLLVGGGDVAPARFGAAAEGDAVDEQRDDFEVRLVHAAKATGTPLLGVCRGCQVLNVALDGTLQEVEHHRQGHDLSTPSHPVELSPTSRLAVIMQGSRFEVNSFHRWSPGTLGVGLTAVARGPGDVVEAVESDDGWWALGIQWHVESLADPDSLRVFEGFVSRAGGGA